MSGTTTLLCWLPNTPIDQVFPVDIDPDKLWGHAKDAIKEKKPNAFADIDADPLKLWKVTIDRSQRLQLESKDFLKNVTATALDSMAPLSTDLNDPIPDDHINIIIVERPTQLPASSAPSLPDSPTSRKRTSEQIESTYEMVTEKWKSKRLKKSLPSLEELAGFINSPLEPSEKIPISQPMFDSLVSSLFPDICSQDDVASVFRVVPDPDPNFMLFFQAASNHPPPPGTEYSYVYFWDSNIRAILERLLPAAKILRNSSHHTSTANLRPDFALLLQALCVLRGEEKSDDTGDPKGELHDKLLWVYDDAPYLLGYTCEGCMMTVVAITAPSASASGKPEIKDLVRIDLSSKKKRIRNIRNLINIAYILPKLVALVRSPVKDFASLARTNSDVEVTSTAIIKTYKSVDAEAKVQHLKGVYALLAGHSIPNTDELITGQGKTVRLCPRGIDTQPEVQRELRECLVCILDALVAAHAIPLFHRDIRWPNVMRSIRDGSKWFLIDWEEAASPPTKAQSSLSREIHSPDVFQDGHGAEVDIWGIGYLIKTCEALDISLDLRALGVRICNESRQLTAQKVMALVTACP